MKPQDRQDYKVIEAKRLYIVETIRVSRTLRKQITELKTIWNVVLGKTETVATYHSKERAEYVAKNLNLDPWFLDRA